MNHDPSPILPPSEIRARLQIDGYVVLRKFINDAQVDKLLSASRKLEAQARRGQWPHLRTLPKQFPPWQATPENGIWGVQHLLHPELPLDQADRNAFMELYFGEPITAVVKAVLGEDACTDDMLIMELFNMLVTPDRDFALRWHRDDVSFDLSIEQEAAALGLRGLPNGNGGVANPASLKPQRKRNPYHTQYNIPLRHDSSLHLIPGSHARPRTADEMMKLAQDPFTNDLDGWVEVSLKPGDVAFYDNDLIHRGVYKADKERLTLHGSVGDVRAGSKRARNVLQHGCAWADQCDFEGLPPASRLRADGMRRRLVELGGREGVVGFAHED